MPQTLGSTSPVIQLKGSEFDRVVRENRGVVVEFYADWSFSCKAAEGLFQQSSLHHGGKLLFARVNVEENRELAEKLQIQTLPTYILYLQGRPVDRWVGLPYGCSWGRFLQAAAVQQVEENQEAPP
ncbi:thioredoxin family protein [Candidatus Hecatella orcuttiae]|uniref:thioredoxin family protein n=1 Tax=Candidatus Hecatella orcuttiae TaxID=1935119 RepID=UPI0028681929|nr:thioredoxin family protein [Candidatus Hecatella orcuttiae]